MSNENGGVKNQVMASVLLKDAMVSLNSTIENCRSMIKGIIDLPRGSNITKDLHCLSTQISYIELIGITISQQITPYLRLTGSTNYLYQRLKSQLSSSSSRIPTTMKSNLLPQPPSICSSTKSSCSYLYSSSSSSKRRPVLQNEGTNCKKHRQLPTRRSNRVVHMKCTFDLKPVNNYEFEIEEAVTVYNSCSGRNKLELVQEWINKKYIPCGKSRFYALRKMVNEKNLPQNEIWINGSGRKGLLTLPEVEDLVLGKQQDASGLSSSIRDIAKTLNEARKNKMKNKGVSVLGCKDVSMKTVLNYKSLAALSNQAAIVSKVQQKTEKRFTVIGSYK